MIPSITPSMLSGLPAHNTRSVYTVCMLGRNIASYYNHASMLQVSRINRLLLPTHVL